MRDQDASLLPLGQLHEIVDLSLLSMVWRDERDAAQCLLRKRFRLVHTLAYLHIVGDHVDSPGLVRVHYLVRE